MEEYAIVLGVRGKQATAATGPAELGAGLAMKIICFTAT
jgi:hypothetical protein